MDIMNNMTVSTSKLTFSLIAITALFTIWFQHLLFQADASSGFNAPSGGGGTDAGFNAPEFTCNHINTTATHLIKLLT